jgi:hypothetical protein
VFAGGGVVAGDGVERLADLSDVLRVGRAQRAPRLLAERGETID